MSFENELNRLNRTLRQLEDERQRSSARTEFLLRALSAASSTVAAIGTLILFLRALDFFAPASLRWFVDGIMSLHWSLAVCASALVLPITSYYRDRSRARNDRALLSTPTWIQLRSFGEERLAKASYVAVVATPILAYVLIKNPLALQASTNFHLPLNLKLGFFSSLALSIALLLFNIVCPPEIRSTSIEQVDSPSKLSGTAPDYQKLNSERLKARVAVFAFFAIGLALALVVLFRSAIYVAYA